MATRTGTSGADTLKGTSSADTLWGRGGSDELHGLGGTDKLYGETGNDHLRGGLGNDRLDGGAGVDLTTWYYEGSQEVFADLSTGKATRGSETDTLISIENLTGSKYADNLSGNAGPNVIQGSLGGDYIFGQEGNDTLIGDLDNDPLGQDSLDGGNGNDRINGGEGADALFGGPGNDIMVGGRGADFFRPEGGNDEIVLGSDAADSVKFFYYGPDPSYESIDQDIVRGFNSAAHTFSDTSAYAFLPDTRLATLDTRDFLDSNDDGQINDADAEVIQVGTNLVLDLDAVFTRAFGGGDFGTQQITLEGAGGGFAIDRMERIPQPNSTYNIPIVTEDGILEPPVSGDALALSASDIGSGGGSSDFLFG